MIPAASPWHETHCICQQLGFLLRQKRTFYFQYRAKVWKLETYTPTRLLTDIPSLVVLTRSKGLTLRLFLSCRWHLIFELTQFGKLLLVEPVIFLRRSCIIAFPILSNCKLILQVLSLHLTDLLLPLGFLLLITVTQLFLNSVTVLFRGMVGRTLVITVFRALFLPILVI